MATITASPTTIDARSSAAQRILSATAITVSGPNLRWDVQMTRSGSAGGQGVVVAAGYGPGSITSDVTYLPTYFNGHLGATVNWFTDAVLDQKTSQYVATHVPVVLTVNFYGLDGSIAATATTTVGG